MTHLETLAEERARKLIDRARAAAPHIADQVRYVAVSLTDTGGGVMTHLEILAGKFDELARRATTYSVQHSVGHAVDLESYYRGKSAGLCLAADLLRQEALERKGVGKEVSE